jgi:Dolichyl-phosphate-mannose-protein mannosyltransferase
MTVVWLRLDRSPPAWDDGYYLTNSLVMYDALTSGGLAGYGKTFLTVMGLKPPLIAVLPTPIYLIFGRKTHAALSVNLAGLVFTFWALYRLGSRYVSRRVGLLAVFIAGGIPLLHGFSRWYLVECGLTAIVCVVICLSAEWNDGGRLWKSVLLGVLCGLGLLMKLSFPVYVLIPILFFTLKDSRAALRPRTLMAFAAPAAAVVLPWYLFHFRQTLAVALKAGSAETAKVYSTGDVFSGREIWRYLGNLSNASPTLYFAALPILLLAFGRIVGPSGKRGLLLCGLWGSPLLVLTLSHYRDLRYAAPLLPALALALAILVDAAIKRHGIAAAAAASLFLTIPILTLLQTSFGVFGDRSIDLGGLLLVGAKFNYVRLYDPRHWPHREILTDIYRADKWSGGERKRVIIGTDNVTFNADNIALAALETQLPFDVRTTAYETDESTLLPLLDSAAYFIYKEGGEPGSPFNRLRSEAINAVREGGRFMELPTPRELPDGGIVHIFRSVSSRRFESTGAFLRAGIDLAGMDAVPDSHVTFDGKLELTGCAMRRTAQGLEVRYRWRCLKPTSRDYWCFTHIVDQQGKIAGYLDHAIVEGEPPTSLWREGDVAIETLLFRLSDTRETGPYQLRLGLFHRASGDRLPITGSDLPATYGNTAAVVIERAARP